MEPLHGQGTLAPTYREIVARAVSDRRTHQLWQTITVVLPAQGKPENILGVVAAALKIDKVALPPTGAANTVAVEATTVVHVWYQALDDTHIARATATFSEGIPVRPPLAGEYSRCQAQVIPLGPPRCSEWRLLPDGQILVEVEATVEVEVTGETRLRVAVFPGGTVRGTPPAADTFGETAPPPLASAPAADADPLASAEEDD